MVLGTRQIKVLFTTIFLLAFAHTATAALYLTVNGQNVDSANLVLGQSYTIEVNSDTTSPGYNAFLGHPAPDWGFPLTLPWLGQFTGVVVAPAADRDLTYTELYDSPAEDAYLYILTAASSSPISSQWPQPGVHFIVTYAATELGTTEIALFDGDTGNIFDLIELNITEGGEMPAINVSPSNGATDVPLDAQLQWSHPLFEMATYAVHWGTDVSAVQSAVTDPNDGLPGSMTDPQTFNPGPLQPNNTYYWRVDVAQSLTDPNVAPIRGSVWSFTTVAAANNTPRNPSPAEGANNVAISPTLTWTGGDQQTSYDLYFGTVEADVIAKNASALVADNANGVSSFAPATLSHDTTYYWRAVANHPGGSTDGPVWSFTTLKLYSGGSGTAANPFQISSVQDLLAMRTDTANLDKHFILTADIDMDPNVTGVSAFTTALINTTFTGVFDGDGYKIKNLTIIRKFPSSTLVGLFREVSGTGAEIKNLGLENVNIDVIGNTHGGLCGRISGGKLTNCYVTGIVKGRIYTGGLCGQAENAIIDSCYFSGSVSGGPVGGLCGFSIQYSPGLTVTDCYATGSVTGNNAVGGLFGMLPPVARITNCYAANVVTSTDVNVGAFAGTGSPTDPNAFENCFWNSDLNPGLMDAYDISAGSGIDLAGVESKTTAEMKTQTTYTGWDFVGTWRIIEGLDYPYLSYEANLGQAFNPAPARGQTNVALNSQLGWSHQLFELGVYVVHIGTNFSTVRSSVTDPNDGIPGSATEVQTFNPGLLLPNTTYYWRVDEVGSGNIHIGPVWSFTTTAVVTTVSVPDVVNMTQANAQSAITGAGLTVGTVTQSYHPTVPAGSVISQSPSAGTQVNPASSVDLVVSLGVQMIAVPNVVSMTQANAQSAITGSGLTVGNVSQSYHTTVPAGTVISQSPTAGSQVAPASSVDLVVSLGIEPATGYSGGSGTSGDPYQISSVSDLMTLSADSANWDKHFIMMADINMDPAVTGIPAFSTALIAPDTVLIPEGFGGDFEGPVFTGVFNGAGHIISNLTIQNWNDFVGLFGVAGGGSKITNLGLENVSIEGFIGVGALAGANGGEITNCYSTGTTRSGAGSEIGGLVGSNGGTVVNCYSTVTVYGGAGYAGGLVGLNHSVISKCYSVGIVVPGGETAGGFVGQDRGNITDSCWNIEVNPLLSDSEDGDLVGVEGKTTSQMKSQSTYTGWDFVDTWWIAEGLDYPHLSYETNNSTTVAVPDVVGMTQANAESAITGASLTVGTITQAYHPTIPAGSVISQTPTAGTQVAPASSVDIVVSLGIEPSTGYSGGSGIEGDPYQLSSANDLMALSNEPNDWDKYFILTADIDMDPNVTGIPAFTAALISPDTNNTNTTFEGTEFRGLFDGGGHKIMNLTIRSVGTGNDYVGLFGQVYGSLGIKNLTLENEDIAADGIYVGGVCGYSGPGSKIVNCHVNGSVSGNNSVGGICGVYGTGPYAMESCSVTGSVSGNLDNVGGLCGTLTGHSTIKTCSFDGTVNGRNKVGGVVGSAGLSGIQNSFAKGSVHGSGEYVGGLGGFLSNAGAQNCYSSSSVGGSLYVGGLCGFVAGGPITNCYAAGLVSGTEVAGGFIGLYTGTAITISSCFWDSDLNFGLMDAHDISSGINLAGVEGKTSAEMWLQSTYTGWDFENTWWINDSIDYPYLSYEARGVRAFRPGPSNGQTSVALDSQLTWSHPGFEFVLYAVHLGTSFNAVLSVVIDFSDPVSGSTTDPQTYNPGPLLPNTTYYWRVDVVDLNDPNSVPVKGNVWSFTTEVAGTTVLVPDVTGLTQANAESSITGAGLTVGTVTQSYHATVPAGNVISQTPTAGTQVVSGSSVDLVISLGVELISIPDVVFMSKENAELAITGAGLSVGTIEYVFGPSAPAGHVISQSPAAGSLVALGSQVNLDISLGDVDPPSNPSPADEANEVGVNPVLYWGGCSQQTSYDLYFSTVQADVFAKNASALIADDAPSANMHTPGLLSYNTTYYWRVVSNHLAGSTDGPVWSFTTQGASLVSVPNVITMTQTNAESAITGAGLTVGTITQSYHATIPAGTVISQSPAAGTQVASGSSVDFVVSLGTGSAIYTRLIDTSFIMIKWYDYIDGGASRINFNNTVINVQKGLYTYDDVYTLTMSGTLTFNPLLVQDYSSGGLAKGYFEGGATVTITGGLLLDGSYVYGGTGASAKPIFQAVMFPVYDDTSNPTLDLWALEEQIYEEGRFDRTLLLEMVEGSEGLAAGISLPNGDILRMYSPEMDLFLKTNVTVSTFGVDIGPSVLQSQIKITGLLPDVVLVPNVVNMTQANAESAITGAGLTVGTVSQSYHATIPAGSVISQSPAAGSQVAAGSSVALVVSLGAAPVANNTPRNPSPVADANNIALNTTLTWTGGDEQLSYDLYFSSNHADVAAKSASARVAESATGANSYNPGTMSYDTTYYWRVVCNHADGSTDGPVWSFTTILANNTPRNPFPADLSATVSVDAILSWTGGDQQISYDLYFSSDHLQVLGKSATALVADDMTGANVYNPGTLAYNGTVYFWRVVCNHPGGATDGPVWSFGTEMADNTPRNPSPADTANDIAINPTLTWTGGDEQTSFDLYFSTSQADVTGKNVSALVADDATSANTYDPGILNHGTAYYWRIVCNHPGGSTDGPVWLFTTKTATASTAAGSLRKIYWYDNNKTTIKFSNPDGSGVETLINGLAEVYGLDVDYDGGRMYISDVGVGFIRCANLDGSGLTNLVPSDCPFGIRVDPACGKIYWVDYCLGAIRCANLDGSDVINLVSGLYGSWDIALDLQNGKIYWVEIGSYSIRSSNLDGSGVQTVVSLSQDTPGSYGLTVDSKGGKIYWTELSFMMYGGKIRCASLDGSGVSTVLTGLMDPYGIQVDSDGNKIYWIEMSNGTIYRADLDGSNKTSLVTGIVNVKNYSIALGFSKNTTTDTFGTGANQFTIDFVTISGDAGDLGSWPSGAAYTFSGVNHEDYRIGKFEITNDQWNKFKAEYGMVTGNPLDAYDKESYTTDANVPTSAVSWYEAAQFVNWLNISTGHHPAYNFTGTQGTADYTLALWSPAEAWGGTNWYRHKDAYYFLPTEDEWIKAAYWNGSSIQIYASVGDTVPVAGVDTNYDHVLNQPWDVGSGTEELNGTYDMMGNLIERIESPFDPYLENYLPDTYRGERGGFWVNDANSLMSSWRITHAPNIESPLSGFRIASRLDEPNGVSTVLVPDVTGLTQAVAESAITGAALTVGTITQAYHATIPAGNVISQSPTAGTQVAAGSGVNLVVSLGIQTAAVPNVVSMTQANAQSAITGAGLAVGTITQSYHLTVPAGNVISQTPAAGTQVVLGSGVNIVVSLGRFIAITTAQQLQAIGADPNNMTKDYRLEADIDLSAYTGGAFNQIGTPAQPYTGTFDGNGHIVSHFNYSSIAYSTVGLFGRIGPAGIVKNLAVFGSVSGKDSVGLLAGINQGLITGCLVQGRVSADKSTTSVRNAGGLAGSNQGRIEQSAGRCDLYAARSGVGDTNWIYIGGLVGYSSGQIADCYSWSAIKVVGGEPSLYIGGFVGLLDTDAAVARCYAVCSQIEPFNRAYAGAFIGQNRSCSGISSVFWDRDKLSQGTIYNCIATPNCQCGASLLSYAQYSAGMRNQSTFSAAGWNFSDVWTMLYNNRTYPALVAELQFMDSGLLDSTWNHELGSPGQLTDLSNWSSWGPYYGIKAAIDNGSTAILSNGFCGMSGLRLDSGSRLDLQSGFLNVSHGLSSFDTDYAFLINAGICTLSSSACLATDFTCVSGSGSFSQSGGLHRIKTALFVGKDGLGAGTYTLSGESQLWAKSIDIGSGGSLIQQTSESRNVVDTLQILDGGTYRLQQGLLSIDAIRVIGSGQLIQTGGTVTSQATSSFDCELRLASGGRYVYQGGLLDAGTITMQGASVIDLNHSNSVLRIEGILDISEASGEFFQNTGNASLQIAPTAIVITSSSDQYNLLKTNFAVFDDQGSHLNIADPGINSAVQDISWDGSVSVGYSNAGSGKKAVYWQDGTAFEIVPPEAGLTESVAYGVSKYANVIVGSRSYSSGLQKGFLWHRTEGIQDLGHLPVLDNTMVCAVSPDGSVVTGSCFLGSSQRQAFRWENGVIRALSFLPGGSTNYGQDVSEGGQVIVGYGNSNNGISEAFRWHDLDGDGQDDPGEMKGLGDIPGGTFDSAAYAVSEDGLVVVGRGRSSTGIEAFRWTENTKMQGLGFLNGGKYSCAYDVSEDGSIVVGMATNAAGQYRVFIWDEQFGMRDLEQFLRDEYNSNAVFQFKQSHPVALSGNGSIVGGVCDRQRLNLSGLISWTTSGWMTEFESFDEFQRVSFEGDSSLMGMAITYSNVSGAGFEVKTTGARYSYQNGILSIEQGLNPDSRRNIASMVISAAPVFVQQPSADPADHILLDSDSMLVAIYGDSTCVLSPKQVLNVNFTGNFEPDFVDRHPYGTDSLAELYILDSHGGICIYPQRYESGYTVSNLSLNQTNWTADYRLNPYQKVMLSVFPCRAADPKWQNSEVVATTGSYGKNSDGQYYGTLPPKKIIQQWKKYADIVHLWHDGVYEPTIEYSDYRGFTTKAAGPYIPYNPDELRRFISDCHDVSDGKVLKVLMYCCPFDYLRLRNRSFEAFHNEVKYLWDNFDFDGIYLDGMAIDCGIYKMDNKIRNWEMLRKLRQLMGQDGIIYYHSSGTGYEHITAPNIDSYSDMTLNGENLAFTSANDSNVLYHVKKEGISNTIAFWKPGPNPFSYWPLVVDEILKLGAKIRWQCPYSYELKAWVDWENWGYCNLVNYSEPMNYLYKSGKLDCVQPQSAGNLMAMSDTLDEPQPEFFNTITVGDAQTGYREIYASDFKFDPNISVDFLANPFLHAKPGMSRYYQYADLGASYRVNFTAQQYLGVNCLVMHETASADKEERIIYLAKDALGTAWLFRMEVDGDVIFEAQNLGQIQRLDQSKYLPLRLISGDFKEGVSVTDEQGGQMTVVDVSMQIDEYPSYSFVLLKVVSPDNSQTFWQFYHESVGLVGDMRSCPLSFCPDGQGYRLADFYDIPLDFNRDREIGLPDFWLLVENWLTRDNLAVFDVEPAQFGDNLVNLLEFAALARQLDASLFPKPPVEVNLKAHLEVVNTVRVSRTEFDYYCKVLIENASEVAVDVSSAQITQAGSGVIVIDPDVSILGKIEPYGLIRSGDMCIIRSDSVIPFDSSEMVWDITHTVAQ
jgi:probable HAF family extracellular repeat protein